MKIVLPKLSCKYGAPLGRSNQDVSGKCHLQRVTLIDGGYDQGGAYWGIGLPLYVAQDKEGHLFFLHANDREDAKAKLLQKFPTINFYR